ncbi:unnamed protein product [Dicrocoelium dendriticum]|nr:unnamed protein product [Dicrocoelium dendriticum]
MRLAVKASLLLLSFWLKAESHSWPSTIFNKNPKKNWAVLVAGSDGWYNYRHQADVCHAYQLLTGRGIPPENVITMMVDDIANNKRNPFRGQIFNDYKHQDVYNGTIIDYKGNEVDPHVLIRVLLGNETLKARGKKVLESGPEDNVFLYFTDHGSAGLIAFPNGELYARKLNETVTKMHASKRYSKFVMYVEACYSGSMFDGILSSKINAYAVTAANPHQSSWASFCEDPVINTCLADEFSHNWMEDTERHSIYNRTLKQQYKSVRARTLKSQVQRYGDMHLDKRK